MKRIVTSLVCLCILVGLSTTPALAVVPPLPHAFYGEVKINNGDAPKGTKVEARGPEVETGIKGNPITVTVPGEYGGPGGFDPKLIVKGDIAPGANLTFYVSRDGINWVKAETEPAPVEWRSGEVSKVKLSATIEAPPPPAEEPAAVGAPTYYLKTDLFGVKKSYRIESDGELRQKIFYEDGLTITITKGTIALDQDGKRLKILEAAVDESPPDPPEDAHIIGLACTFEPEGATFDPGITLTWRYDPDAMPEGVAEEDLVIAYYDEDAKKWVGLDGVVDTKNDVITASVPHFTTFAIIGGVTPAAFTLTLVDISPTEVAPDEKVNISISVANTGGMEGSYTVVLKINGVKEAVKSVTVAAGESQVVTFSVTREQAGTYNVMVAGLGGSFTVVAPVIVAPPAPTPPVPAPAPVPPPPAPVPPPPVVPVPAPPAPPPNWLLFGGIIAATVLVALIIFFLVRRRRADY